MFQFYFLANEVPVRFGYEQVESLVASENGRHAAR